MKRHILLIGLPGSGKTSAGRLAAHELGCAFTDIDERIVDVAKKSVAAIFADEGEARFRALEREQMARALEEPPAVLAPGGGWAAEPRALDGVGNRAWLVYLETTAAVAAERAAAQGPRPLLGSDPIGQMEVLLAQRVGQYERAHRRVQTDRRTVREVAQEIVRLARSGGGW